MYILKQLRSYQVVFLGIAILFLSGCTLFPQIHEDLFYNDTGEFDSFRFPLIKPYYMVYLDKEFSWQMPFLSDSPSKNMYYYYNLHGIRKLAVKNGVIMVYTPYIEDNIDTSIGQKIFHWFVIVPSQNIENGFESEEEFLKYIHTLGIDKPLWIEPDTAYNQFSKTGCLDWIPGCK